MKKYMYTKLITALLVVLAAYNADAQVPTYRYTAATTGANTYPWNTSTAPKLQGLYQPSMFTGSLGVAPQGKIVKIYWQAANAPGTSSYTNLEIKLGHTAITTLVTGPWNTGLTTVFSAPTHTITGITTGSWVGFDLQTPFNYNPNQNLIIESSTTAYSNGFNVNNASPGYNGRLYGTIAAPTGAGTQLCNFGFDMKLEDSCIAAKAGFIEASDTAMCANLGYEYILMNNTHSYNDTDTVGYVWYWETSIDGLEWHNLVGSMGKDTITNTFSGEIWYRMHTICTNGFDTAHSNTVRIRAKAPEKCYCYSQSAGPANDSSDIGALTVYNYSNNVGGPHLLNPRAVKRRTDYTDLNPIELFIDSSYKFEVKQIMKGSFHKNAQISIFMDFNNNNKYDIPHERIYRGNTGSTSFVLTPAITIPDSAIQLYPTGMRIILNEDLNPNAASDSACGPYGSGETEDYMVMFHRAFPTSVSGTSQLSSLSLYPNPATDLFTVRFSAKEEIEDVTMTVTNLTGQSVMKESYRQVGNSFYKEITTDGWAKGVYFVEINVDGEKITRKLILQ